MNRPAEGAGRRWRARPTALVLALGIAVTAAPVSAQELDQELDADQEVVTGTTVLDHGHIDVGPRFVDGEWTLLIHDDAAREQEGGTSVWRYPDETVLQVTDAGVLTVPDEEAYEFLGVPGGQPVHVVPQTQHPEVIWLGWNTQDPEVMETIDRGVTLSLLGVEGPGQLLVYLQSGSFEEPDILWDSRETGPQPAWIDVNTHAHANWVFSEPGIYLTRFEITADLIDGRTVTDTQDLRFAVGDAASTDDALAANPTWDDLTGDDADAASLDPDDAAAADTTAGGQDDGPPVGVITIAVLAVAVVTAGTVFAVRGRAAKRRALDGRTAS